MDLFALINVIAVGLPLAFGLAWNLLLIFKHFATKTKSKRDDAIIQELMDILSIAHSTQTPIDLDSIKQLLEQLNKLKK